MGKNLFMVLRAAFFIVIIPLLPLLISRDWQWTEAWLFAGIQLMTFIASRLFVAKKHPALIKERGAFTKHENTEKWDKILVIIMSITSMLFFVVLGVERRLNIIIPVSIYVKVIALVVMLFGQVISSIALIENEFFSGVVRIQAERNHRVISTGIYGMIRHPGYAGGIITYLGVLFFFGRGYFTFFVILDVAIMIIRTKAEDDFLKAKLHGYKEYAQKVRFRLFPGIW